MKVGYSKRVLDVETPTLLAGTHLDRKVHNDTQNLELHSIYSHHWAASQKR